MLDTALLLRDNGSVRLRQIAQPLRVALTGSSASPPLFDVIHLLGRERCIARIVQAIENYCSGNGD